MIVDCASREDHINGSTLNGAYFRQLLYTHLSDSLVGDIRVNRGAETVGSVYLEEGN